MLLSVFLVARKVTIFNKWIVFSLVLLTSSPSVNVFFSFLPHLRIRPCFVLGQNTTFKSLGSLLKVPVIQTMMICNPRGHDEVLGSEPHCPQSGFLESLIPSCVSGQA